ILALQVRGVAAETIPDSTLIDHPEAGDFTLEVIGGKSVRRGTLGMIEQGEDSRGLPYLYDAADTRYIIITDDPDWAADVLGQLHPPQARRARVRCAVRVSGCLVRCHHC